MKKPPSLRTLMESQPIRRHGPKCSVCALPPETLEEVNAIMRDYEAAPMHRRLSSALIAQGFTDMNRQRLGHHYEAGHHHAKA